MTDQKTQHAECASRLSVGLEVSVKKPDKFCLSCLGSGGRWFARFDGFGLSEWKKCKVCTTSNV